MESGRIGLSWPIARTLFGNHMYQNRNIRFQRMTDSPLQCGDIMAINRRRAYNSQLLKKHGVRHDKLLQRFFCRFAQFHHGLACRTKRVLHKILHVVTVFTVIARNTQCTQVHCHCANIACNTHFVVVQDDNERRLCLADIVERLECHTTSKRSIANKSHDLLIVATQIARTRQSARYGKRVGSMTGRMNIMRVAVGLRKARQPLVLAKRGEFI